MSINNKKKVKLRGFRKNPLVDKKKAFVVGLIAWAIGLGLGFTLILLLK